jgi:3'5'-cyclic nucleotide phosphodiesterase
MIAKATSKMVLVSNADMNHVMNDNNKRRSRHTSCTAEGTESCVKAMKATLSSPIAPIQSRLIQCHFQLLSVLLERVTAQRAIRPISCSSVPQDEEKSTPRCDAIVADEITEVVEVQNQEVASLQSTDEGSESSLSDTTEDELPSYSSLSPKVQTQLRLFLERIADCYLSTNPFHNFMHASHVTFSCYQLLRKVAVQDLPPIPKVDCSASDGWSALPTSSSACGAAQAFAGDALAHFAVVFSAVIHDVNHLGVPNFLLAKEKPEVAEKYHNRSIAEQTSLDVAWEILEQECFSDLRSCIFPSKREYSRFRAMVVNIVMATDTFDEALRKFQDKKWVKAFASPPECAVEQRNRKATVMMDLIMMSSDISHTMQSFEVYCEWNERLYREMYAAYLSGRSQNDPSSGWVAGELIFFDKHIIPLVERIQESGMFGTTADTLVKNAKSNRKAWATSGKRIFEDLQARVTCSLIVEGQEGPTGKKAKLNPVIRPA